MTIRVRTIGLVAASLLAACSRSESPGGDELPAPRGRLSMASLDVSNVSFGGAPVFETATTPSRATADAVEVGFVHTTRSGSERVRLLVPATIYKGTGTYVCAGERDRRAAEFSHCSVWLTHEANGQLAQWSTTRRPAPGAPGAPGACTIAVTSTSPRVAGTVHCPELELDHADGGHPDAARRPGVSGSWSYRARSR